MGRATRRRGFTLIELLVVITIILLISAVTLPSVWSSLSHRQVSEAARILQGALVGARDAAVHHNTPSGIRLLPDPAFPIVYLASGQIDPAQPLAANRIVPIESAPQYTEGAVNVFLNQAYAAAVTGGLPCLVIEESLGQWDNGATPNRFVPGSPTSWFWNVRVGDKIQVNAAGQWYTVIGPMTVRSGAGTGNPELFVNVGASGTGSPLSRTLTSADGQTITVQPEFLLLVNGRDDTPVTVPPTPGQGWIDEGFDGIDNDNDNLVDETTCTKFPTGGEWVNEVETWGGSLAADGASNAPYTIQRRPVPSINAREVALPSNVVIDLTTWGGTQERSRLTVNPYTGYVDLVVYPNGTVVPTSVYSTPASVGLSGAFSHFWLAERSDVAAPTATTAPALPLGNVQLNRITGWLTGGVPVRQQLPVYNGPSLKGEYRLMTLFNKTGRVMTADTVVFDNPGLPAGAAYNPSYPFLLSQQGLQ